MAISRCCDIHRRSLRSSEIEKLSDRIRVLIVDDEPSICRALKVALERAGYSVRTAQSGDSALATIAAERFDVLLIDLRIPDTRGDVVFELAAAAQPHLRSQTVFMSGDLTERAHRLILSCKCPSLRKPFELSELLAVIKEIAPRRESRSQPRSA